jgi:TonB family protein
MARRSDLESRVRGILDSATNRHGLTRRAVVLAVSIFICVILPVSAMRGQSSGKSKAQKIGDGVSAPKLIWKVEPQYTQEARDAGIEGTVMLTVEISEEGMPDTIEIKSGLDPGLDRNAVDAVEQWLFKPGEKDGKPVRVAATIEINFRLY